MAEATEQVHSSAVETAANGRVTFEFENVESPKRMQNESDKALGIVRHIWDVPVRSIQKGLVKLNEPNPRPEPNVRKKVAQQVTASLMNQDVPMENVFHLAHLGLTIVGEVDKRSETTYAVTFNIDDNEEPADGVVNGLHTLAVFAALANEDIPTRQYVTLTVISGIHPRDRNVLIPWIARGRNTVLQVKDESIDNLIGLFDPYKKALEDQPYFDLIGWEESANTPYDVLDLLAIQTATNPEVFANEPRNAGDEVTHPVTSYEKQSACLKLFEDDQYRRSYLAGLPILAELLHLYDLIRSTAVDAYNDAVTGGKGGRLRIVEKRYDRNGKLRPDAWEFPFIPNEDGTYGTRGPYRLSAGSTFAILAAFRVFVRLDKKTGKLRWDGGFKTVLEAWKDLGGELMVACAETSQSLGGANNMNAVGKHRPLWRSLHGTVKGYAAAKENQRLRAQLEVAQQVA